jgi:FkbH-like protein
MTHPQTDLALHWLREPGDFNKDLAAILESEDAHERWNALVALSGRRLDFLQTIKLDRALAKAEASLDVARGSCMKVALVGSAILDPSSGLHQFGPDAVFLSLDARAVVPNVPLGTSSDEVAELLEARIEEFVRFWRSMKERLGAAIIQQTVLPVEPPTFGHFERLVPSSRGAVAAQFDYKLVNAAAREGVVLLDLRNVALRVGAEAMTNPVLWHHAKQEIAPTAVPWVGDQIGRILAAMRGLSKKVLVLDLDNTVWGGVIGDDGIEGIVLGQGSAAGEAYVAFQQYVKGLSERGIILAVSSKNDAAVAEAAFSNHPEMVLRRQDIAAFEASWGDKPTALRRIAQDLNVGLDSLVFFDDNPAERELMRQTLPMVAVPEVPEAVERYIACLSDAGYFEAVAFTADDRQRTEQYAANSRRKQLGASTTDLQSFLRDLDMRLMVLPFMPVDTPRITQLINKTNQFNVMTRRYTEAEVTGMMNDPSTLTFSARLDDCFGSNGIISIVIGRIITHDGVRALDLDTWLMSCRVLGRSVENALLAIVAETARQAGVERLIGHYRPTPKNGMVRDLFPKLGFKPVAGGAQGDETVWEFFLTGEPIELPEYFSLSKTAEAAQ